MKSKLVLWGNDANDVKVLVALQLRPEDNKVDVWTFPVAAISDEFSRTMLHEWRDGAEIEFPPVYTHVERDLTGSILPDDLKVDKIDLVQRAQTEWHFLVLSHKLDAAYHSELEAIKDRVAKLENYDQNIWDELKSFWDKVRGQVNERNLMREQADSLRDNINTLFTQLKGMRSLVDDEFRQNSQANFDKFASKLGEIETRIKDQINTSDIFEELKRLQGDFKEVVVSRDFRFQIWDRIDSAFKAVKEKRFGSSYNSTYAGGSATERTSRRYENLLVALDKMVDSIARDREELKTQQDRTKDSSVGQLELQISEAKINMIQTRIASKEEKLAAMNTTKVELEGQKNRAAARERTDAAPSLAAEMSAVTVPVVQQVQDAAAKIVAKAQEVTAPVQEAVQDAVTEMVAKAQEVAVPVQEAFSEMVTKAQDAVAEMVAEVKEAAAPVKEAVVEMSEPIAPVKEAVVEAAVATQEAVVEAKQEVASLFARTGSHPDDADAADLAF